MLVYSDAAAIAAAPTAAPVDDRLRRLIADRVRDWAATDLLGLTHLLVVGPGDTEKDIVDEVAFSPLVNSLDGKRFSIDEDFVPPCDFMAAHPGSFELVQTFSDGFAFVIFVIDDEGTDPQLLAMCRTFATADEEEPA